MGEKQACWHLQLLFYSVVTANDALSFSFPAFHSTKEKLKPKPAIFIFDQIFLSPLQMVHAGARH